MIKVVPPKKWKATNINYEDIMEDLKILGPIEQNTYGKGGVYELLLIQKKTLTVTEYKKKVEDFNKVTDGKTTD